MKYAQSRATARTPTPVRFDKMARTCTRCGAGPYMPCIMRRSGRYTHQPDGVDGGYDVRLKQPHRER